MVESWEAGGGRSPIVAPEHLLAPRRQIEAAVAAALAELPPHGRWITVTVEDPDDDDLVYALALVVRDRTTAAEVAAHLGVPVTEPAVIGWASEWVVSARYRGSAAGTSVSPTTDPAELAVDLADWLRTFLADDFISDPVPPCPGHPHPMRPVVHERKPWWTCPRDSGLIRPWPAQVTDQS